MKLKMTPHPIPRYLSKPSLYFLISILLLALFIPAPFAIISPGPVTNLLSKGIKIAGSNERQTSGKLFSLSVFVNNPDSRPPGILVLRAWLRGDSLVLPNEMVYAEGETSKVAAARGKKDMESSEELAAIAAANFLKQAQPEKPLNWKISDIKFVMKNVGGPSAGLAFALALIAKLSNPELIAGRKIAVTGTITESGIVGGIGGVDQKLLSAIDAGTTIAVIPKANCQDITVKTDGLEIIAVNSLSEAFHGLASPTFASTLRCPS